MLQWVSVLIAGLIGGAAITVVKGRAGPLPPLLKEAVLKLEREHPWWSLFIFYLPLNGFLGMVASFLVWALGTAGDLQAQNLSGVQWATYIVTGFGGGSIIDALSERTKKAKVYDDMTTTLADALKKQQEQIDDLKKKR